MKIKKRYIIIPIVIAILIVAIGAGIVLLDRISQKKQIEKDEKNYYSNSFSSCRSLSGIYVLPKRAESYSISEVEKTEI